jgi:hypothetical protein
VGGGLEKGGIALIMDLLDGEIVSFIIGIVKRKRDGRGYSKRKIIFKTPPPPFF